METTKKKLRARPIIKKIYKEIKEEIVSKSIEPHLKIIVLGEDPAAAYYVNSIVKKGKKTGINVSVDRLSDNLPQKEMEDLIIKYNNDSSINGIMIQKPLPKQINDEKIVNLLDPKKDVDGLHPLNLGYLVLDKEGFVPCTPGAVLEILDFYDIETSGKNVVVIGRSDIVGKPMANLLLRKNKVGNSTVTVCHSRT
ncbi:MAG: bifunctional 5,10-methylenetetrahydrofolate dehydrogenase/5,10-methenyltetrahydrofolate cyclohydrolase, partial [Candidatus Cloacimonadota bacterium]|nr:bifunctional 5,10-methylenetetrahydrofolate dehydrogenase/5,10-methenyltetrahydrofolate cyclohydrolase [Candidatus Cloacimonadota bacterium]